MDLEQKRLAKPLQVKATDEVGTIDGHGSVFDAPHPTSSWALDPEWKDVIRPGAFARTLTESKKRGANPVMLYQHERGNVIGAWQQLAEDGDGLAMKGQVSQKALAPSGVPIYDLLKMGAINGLSIGFRVRKQALDQEKKLREILDVELGEVSIVDMPGDPNARVTDVKGDPRNIQFLEMVLRDAGLSRKEAKAVLAEGFNALRDAAAEPSLELRDAARAGGGSDDAAALLKSMADFRASHKF